VPGPPGDPHPACLIFLADTLAAALRRIGSIRRGGTRSGDPTGGRLTVDRSGDAARRGPRGVESLGDRCAGDVKTRELTPRVVPVLRGSRQGAGDSATAPRCSPRWSSVTQLVAVRWHRARRRPARSRAWAPIAACRLHTKICVGLESRCETIGRRASIATARRVGHNARAVRGAAPLLGGDSATRCRPARWSLPPSRGAQNLVNTLVVCAQPRMGAHACVSASTADLHSWRRRGLAVGPHGVAERNGYKLASRAADADDARNQSRFWRGRQKKTGRSLFAAQLPLCWFW